VEGAHDHRVELPAELACDLLAGRSPRERAPIGPVARHCVERVRDREDPRADGDIPSAQPVRIPVPVPAFVMRADDLEPGAAEEGDAAEHLLAENRVRLHLRPLLGSERAGLLEDAVRDPDLPHVVEEEAVLRARIVGEVTAQGARQLERVALDPLRVRTRATVLGFERRGERGDGLPVALRE
jgi:hypothetical protein